MNQKRLNDRELFAQYYYFLLIDILNNEGESLLERLFNLFAAFKEIIRELAGYERQFFSNDFARLVFLLDKYSVSYHIAANVKQYHYLMKHRIVENDDIVNENNLNECIALLADFVFELTAIKQPEILSELKKSIVPSFFVKHQKTQISKRIDFLQAVVKEIKEDENILFLSIADSDDVIEFKPVGVWQSVIEQVHIGSTLNLINVFKDAAMLTTYSGSIIIIEPDYLFDATEIAEAFDFNGFNPYALFIKRISAKTVSMQMVLGNIVNTIFDNLIINPLADFDGIYYKALKERVLSVFLVAKLEAKNKIIIKESAKAQYDTLKEFVDVLELDSFAIEPTFISPKFGLQGRLDLLAEFHNAPNRKNIYELKSGNPAKLNQFFKKDGSLLNTGVYVNHFAQVTIYNMLLDTCYHNRKGNSAIVYSKDSENPLRNVPNYKKMKQEIALARNKYLALEYNLLNGRTSLFSDDWDINFKYSPFWIKDDYNKFKELFNNASPIAREYFERQLLFVLNELYAMKLGVRRNNAGFATLWKDSISEKKQNGTILSGLTLLEDESDFDNLHLAFAYSPDDNMNSAFRKGDICILYPDEPSSEFSPLRGRLIKCSIKELAYNRIIVSIRNKLEHRYFAANTDKWILDYDNTDALQKSILHSLTAFLGLKQEKQDLLLGLIEPKFDSQEYDLPDYLSAEQKDIMQKILVARDYFLLQGPPGTGKTRFMLAGLVETLITQTDDNILILAYTNRAVDEICSALKSLPAIRKNTFDIIRLGRKDSTIHKDIVLSNIIERNDINIVYKELQNTRIFIATVATIITYPELLNFKKFDTAIIDEASQITESNLIGILASVERFVLIGDEKQLPAIVLQNTEDSGTDNMKEIYFDSSKSSLFERLLDCAKTNTWTNAYAMLTRQARMHADIMDFPGMYFYNGQLKIFDEQLQNADIDRFVAINGFLSKELSEHRFIFINTQLEFHSKYNRSEAEAVSRIIQTIMRVYEDSADENTLGVISPFRLQCANIQKRLPASLKDIITVDTVEKFQGSQREYIIISMAVNNPYLLDKAQSLRVIDGQTIDRKLNVAITRAKSHIVILGNEEILSQSPVYSLLIDYCKSNNAFYNLSDLLSVYND